MAKKTLKKMAKSVVKHVVRSAQKASKAATTTHKAVMKAKAKPAAKASAPKKSQKAHKPVKAAKVAVQTVKTAKKASPAAKTAAVKATTAKTAPVISKAVVLKTEKKSSKTAATALSGAAPQAAPAPKKNAASRLAARLLNRCREVACDSVMVGAGYCRLHYIKNWKQIKAKEVILSEGQLNRFIEELVAKYPDKYIETIRFDLSLETEFAKIVLDLNLDETAAATDEFGDDDDAADDGIIENIKKETIEEFEEF